MQPQITVWRVLEKVRVGSHVQVAVEAADLRTASEHPPIVRRAARTDGSEGFAGLRGHLIALDSKCRRWHPYGRANTDSVGGVGQVLCTATASYPLR